MMIEVKFLKVKINKRVHDMANTKSLVIIGQAICVDILEECYLLLTSIRDTSDTPTESAIA